MLIKNYGHKIIPDIFFKRSFHCIFNLMGLYINLFLSNLGLKCPIGP